jgi:hypothetical protein
MQSQNEREDHPQSSIRIPSRKEQWGETLLIGVLVALGGIGLWIGVADPLFGGPEAAVFARTLFAFIAGMGLVATLLIWFWPAVWDRWFHQVPPEGGNRLDVAQLITSMVFGLLILAMLAAMVAFQWGPVTLGIIGGALLCSRLFLEIGLHHRLGKRPSALCWQVHHEVGRKNEAVQTSPREKGASLIQTRDAVEGLFCSRSTEQREGDDALN